MFLNQNLTFLNLLKVRREKKLNFFKLKSVIEYR